MKIGAGSPLVSPEPTRRRACFLCRSAVSSLLSRLGAIRPHGAVSGPAPPHLPIPNCSSTRCHIFSPERASGPWRVFSWRPSWPTIFAPSGRSRTNNPSPDGFAPWGSIGRFTVHINRSVCFDTSFRPSIPTPNLARSIAGEAKPPPPSLQLTSVSWSAGRRAMSPSWRI